MIPSLFFTVLIMNNTHLIKYVEPKSLAQRAGIAAGDILYAINGMPVSDILEYRYLCCEDFVKLTVQKQDGRMATLDIKKDPYHDLGMEFTYPLMSKPRRCHNKCIFCFIDQLPPGMRETLYFKDDDTRLSLLHGNYVSATNLSETDIGKICKMRISPINISVHATNSNLRIRMLGNKNAGNILIIMQKFAAHRIEMNTQIVLCKGVNDGQNLEYTLRDLAALHPQVHSVSVVPVGISRHREGLYPLQPFDKQDCRDVIEQVATLSANFLTTLGTCFVFLADEFYIKGEMPLPNYDHYEDFAQLENGIGMMTCFLDEFSLALDDDIAEVSPARVAVATGTLAYPYIQQCTDEIEKRFPMISIKLIPVRNDFFGENITVSGLLCGCDIIAQMGNLSGYDRLVLPSNLLRHGEDVLLDDFTLDELSKQLHIPNIACHNGGDDFLYTILGHSACTDATGTYPSF